MACAYSRGPGVPSRGPGVRVCHSWSPGLVVHGKHSRVGRLGGVQEVPTLCPLRHPSGVGLGGYNSRMGAWRVVFPPGVGRGCCGPGRSLSSIRGDPSSATTGKALSTSQGLPTAEGLPPKSRLLMEPDMAFPGQPPSVARAFVARAGRPIAPDAGLGDPVREQGLPVTVVTAPPGSPHSGLACGAGGCALAPGPHGLCGVSRGLVPAPCLRVSWAGGSLRGSASQPGAGQPGTPHFLLPQVLPASPGASSPGRVFPPPSSPLRPPRTDPCSPRRSGCPAGRGRGLLYPPGVRDGRRLRSSPGRCG